MLRRTTPVDPHDPPRATVPAQGVDVAPPRPGTPNRFAERLRAAGIHLLLSVAIAAGVLALVRFGWYPAPMPALLGVDRILAIMLAVDVVLGPLFTLLVFDRRKPSLALDLAVIGAVQLGALAYGVHAVEQGRPAFVVFVKDRFETVAPTEIGPAARQAAAGNPLAVQDPLRPRWVAASLPAEAEARNALLLEALSGGRDAQHHPKLYVPLEAERATLLERALPIERLRSLNTGRGAAVDDAVRASGRPESALRYLPIRGAASDGAVIVDATDARVLAVVPLAPW